MNDTTNKNNKKRKDPFLVVYLCTVGPLGPLKKKIWFLYPDFFLNKEIIIRNDPGYY